MLHVPESARITDHPRLGTTAEAGNNGAFDLESPAPGWRLSVICSDGIDLAPHWEHVSVHAYRDRGRASTQRRTPSWDEMQFVKRAFWDDEDVVMQLHPRRSQYVNNHPNVLHLWRPLEATIPEPPTIYV